VWEENKVAFDPVTAIANVVGTVLERVLPDKAQKDAAKATLDQMQQKGELDLILGQQAINVVEAGSSSVFVAGWRPFIGWVCGSAFAWNFVVGPIAEWVATFFGVATQIPPLDSSVMMPVLLGMLGLGGLRTYEKTKNGK
jgi:hypothetical protein